MFIMSMAQKRQLLYTEISFVIQFQSGLIHSLKTFLNALSVLFFSRPVCNNDIKAPQNVHASFQMIVIIR